MSAIGFTGATIDRADAIRGDPAKLAATRADPAARLLLLDGVEPVVTAGRLARRRLAPDDAGLALLGLEAEGPLFVLLRPSETAQPPAWDSILALDPDELALYVAARSLLLWHARHGFCANCGHETAPFRAGWGRTCPGCTAEHFPRVDPVVIMLAEHEGRVLLGRQPRFPPGRYSALAGFAEPGESIEEAVARELKEEAGVTATAVRYVASQPWPFPSQLMIACIAEVADDRLTVDGNELEDARWFTRAEVVAALAEEPQAAFIPPPPHAIARTLMETWVAGAVSSARTR